MENQVASDMAANALKSVNYDIDSLDYLLVANDFGDITEEHYQVDIVPSIAAKTKLKAGIKNPRTIALDLVSGCPGWLEAAIFAHSLIQSGLAKRVGTVGTETLSRVSDPHDMDSMIYSDGAGAVIFESKESDNLEGIVSLSERTDPEYSHLLKMGKSNNPNYQNQNRLFLKMDGHELYKYAVRKVPEVIKESLSKADLTLSSIKMILAHQANERLDTDILKRLGLSEEDIKKLTPMTISWLANSSVATIPTLLDLVLRGKINDHRLEPGDNIIIFSVGAGMNRNAMVYKVPII